MPRKSRRPKINFRGRSRRRRDTTPNVYIAPEDDRVAADADDLEDTSPEAEARRSRRQARAEARRTRGRRGRQAPMRAAVYSEYLPAELRKLSILTAGLAVVLVVLTFTLG